jgi:hypothetical protein
MPPAHRSLFTGLVDDAALFPPGNAAMDVGLREHVARQATAYGAFVGPFLCAASRITELVASLPYDAFVEVALLLDVTDDAARDARRVANRSERANLVWLEAAHDRLGDDHLAVSGGQVRLAGPMAYLEVPRTGFRKALDLVGTPGWRGAKYRTGGTKADAFPNEYELADFIVACTERELPFKLTAGLHHAVRHIGADTGFEHHGVLNVLVATSAAREGTDVSKVADLLGQRDAATLADTVSSWSESHARDVRSSFRSFGCCGVTDPIDDLAELGLIQLDLREDQRA